MSNKDTTNRDSESPDYSKQRASKSVRWTGQDYFSYHGGSANRPGQSPSGSATSSNRNEDDEYSDLNDSSDSSSDEDDEHDEHSANVRAATRANTWFNRLRKDIDDDHQNVDDTEENTENTNNHGNSSDIDMENTSHSPDNTYLESAAPVPVIQVSSHHDMNPYSHLLDIGTNVSAGLAPGGKEYEDNDPLDDEYRERRNRLLASLGTHSQPSSPQLSPLDPMDQDSIPLRNLNPPRNPTPASPFGSDFENGNTTESFEEASDDENEMAKEAELLRKKLQSTQSQRVHLQEKAIAARIRRGEANAGGVDDETGSDSSSDDESEHFKTKEEEEEEELRRLEDQARQEAEEHAKNLVKSHLASNLLKPDHNNDGYVENNGYLFDAGLLDEDYPASEEMEHNHSSHKDISKSDHLDKHAIRETSSTSDDSISKVKGSNKPKETQNDNSDSDSESEDEHRGVSLRGDPDYIPPPKKVKEGVLGSLLRLYAGQDDDDDKSTTTSASGSPNVTPLGTPSSTPLASPSINTAGTPSEYSLSTNEGPGLPNASNATTVSGSNNQKKWKRPGYFHTHSSEDVLGRESKGRPKWYKRNSTTNAPSLSQLASSGFLVAGGAASNAAMSVASSAAHHAHPNFSRRLGKTGNGAPSSPADAAAAKLEKKNQDAKYHREKEAKKQAKKAEQKRREKEKALKKARLAEQARITVHIADVLQRQRFLLRLGRALMLFGAPSHRLEEYLKSTARVLEIDAQVLYIPGCILVSFGDATTHTSETKLIRVTQGLNLAKLHSTHLIYKEVVHDLMSLEEASSHIDHLLRSKNVYPWWMVVFFYGIACMCCGMFAYGAFWRDMPIIFLLGGGVGFLQFWVQPRSDLYANVFEVSSSIVVSFAGRAFGSIGDKSDYVFCFASIVQASLALILPGYIILVGALELQTKNLVAGSVRMFYANIYSLFLSFGITLGSAIFGWIYRGAVTNTTCQHSADVDPKWKILFVPAATLFMGLVNQASLRQLPIMVIIGSSGYAVQYFVQINVKAAAFTSAIGAFTMGVIGNLYSRVGHGLAFAAMLPGIFVLVPSGVAAQGSLVAGVKVATQIVNSSKTNGGSSDNSTQTISDLGNAMTQVAVGIVVGLFAATLVVYPLGFKKKRSGLFTF